MTRNEKQANERQEERKIGKEKEKREKRKIGEKERRRAREGEEE